MSMYEWVEHARILTDLTDQMNKTLMIHTMKRTQAYLSIIQEHVPICSTYTNQVCDNNKHINTLTVF